MIRKYVKKPVEIEAVQWAGVNFEEIKEFVGESLIYNTPDMQSEGIGYANIGIKTLEGNHFVSDGDYIIKGIKGEFYPCKPDIFEETYDLVEELEKANERDYRDGIPGVHYYKE